MYEVRQVQVLESQQKQKMYSQEKRVSETEFIVIHTFELVSEMQLYKDYFVNSSNKDAFVIRAWKISEEYSNLNYI